MTRVLAAALLISCAAGARAEEAEPIEAVITACGQAQAAAAKQAELRKDLPLAKQGFGEPDFKDVDKQLAVLQLAVPTRCYPNSLEQKPRAALMYLRVRQRLERALKTRSAIAKGLDQGRSFVNRFSAASGVVIAKPDRAAEDPCAPDAENASEGQALRVILGYRADQAVPLQELAKLLSSDSGFTKSVAACR